MSTGPPTTSPSSLSYTAISSTTVTISWSSSSEKCLDYYSVNVTNQSTNQEEIFNTTSTSLTISNRLEGVQYTYTVAVVDGANRSGPQSYSGCLNLDSKLQLVIAFSGIYCYTILIAPEQVPSLTAMATCFPHDLTQSNVTAIISVQWMVSVVYYYIICNYVFV